MVGPTSAPPVDLANAVRTGQWAEVRALTGTLPAPLPPAVALAAARAAAALGDPERALVILRQALPNPGELAGALRLEAARLALARGHDPFPLLAPLFARSDSATLRHAACSLVRDAAEGAPLPLLRSLARRSLPRPLRRELRAVIAVRSGDTAAALRLLEEREDDRAASNIAQALVSRGGLALPARLRIASALLAGGAWREAQALLARPQEPAERAQCFRLAFLRGRAAYRLDDSEDAARSFDEALAVAATREDRFAAAVQRARTAERATNFGVAVTFYDAARTAAPREVEGWDGAARCRAALGRGGEAAALALRAPPAVFRVVGPRLAALLLARGDTDIAAGLLARLPASLSAARLLRSALALKRGNADAARATAAALLADPRAGEWRELALDLLPPPAPSLAAPPTRDPATLADLAVKFGANAARDALARALQDDPEWARLLTDSALPPALGWSGPAAELAAAGLETDAARLYPDRFPAGSPEALAWSAAALAAWGNPPAALSYGERLAGRLQVPAVLLPDALLVHVLPAELVGAYPRIAGTAGIPATWLAAVVRRESRFDLAARSGAGALGVAQLVPEVWRRLGAEEAEAWEGERALRLASCELARLRALFGAHLLRVAAAYNAGETAVASWLHACGGDVDDPLFALAVPYRETSGYVLGVKEGAELSRTLASASAGGG